ncbi:hypothetical protein C8J57DRAFT_1234451 [Mycena rebaudengoi]|nr:hypothetical protein C8J57DRAFT_1234451 [Mycena rebaudengoi]
MSWCVNSSISIQPKIAGVGTILELEPDIFGGGGGALARGTELRPRLNVLCRTLWSLQRAQKSRQSFGKPHKASTKAEFSSLGQKSRRSFASARSTELPPRLNMLRRTFWSLQRDSKIPAEDAGVGTILELEPDISGGGGGGALASGTELRPRLDVLCQTLWSLQLGSKFPAQLRQVTQSFDQG